MRCIDCGEKEDISFVYDEQDRQLGIRCHACGRLAGYYLVYELEGMETLRKYFDAQDLAEWVWKLWIGDLLKRDQEKVETPMKRVFRKIYEESQTQEPVTELKED
jgi:hypothetical protein